MRGKSGKAHWSSTRKLCLFTTLLLCVSSFLLGLFGRLHLSLSQEERGSTLRSTLRQSISDGGHHHVLPAGQSGDDSFSSIPFQVLSWRPRALYFPNFATAEQCQTIINLAKPSLRPSTLALRQGETEESTKGIRTSSGVFISASEDKSGILDGIEEKIARATMYPRVHGEAFNILRYEIGQRYNSHYDAFNPTEYGPQKSQRVASFLLYLSDVEEGGETMFPFENGSGMDAAYDFETCTGLRVKPQQGDGLLFYSLFPNGTIDVASLHGSCPVIKGEKWVATKWIRDQIQFD